MNLKQEQKYFVWKQPVILHQPVKKGTETQQ